MVKYFYRVCEYLQKSPSIVCETQDVYNTYKKYMVTNGLWVTLKKEKLGQVISKVYRKILIKVRVINRVKRNFHQDFRLIQEMERGANNPVVYMHPHISSCTEHEITSYVIKTVYIHDGLEMDFTFCINSETGLFDVYFGKDEITNLGLFGILPQSEHDQFFCWCNTQASRCTKAMHGNRLCTHKFQQENSCP